MAEPSLRRAREEAGVSARQHYAVACRAQRRRQIIRAMLLAGGTALVVCGVRASDVRFGIAGFFVAAFGAALRPDRDLQRWLRGAAGEERSALYLQGLRPSRWQVLHDRTVPGLSINLDHVVIGRSGVWLVDTKAYRAPLRRRWRHVEAGGRPIDTEPAAWEAELMAERLGADVTPIVAVHGRGLGPRGGRCAGVRVIPAESLVRRLRGGRRRLSRAEVHELGARADRLFPPRSRPAKQGRRATANDL